MSSHHIRTAVVSALAALTAVTATACTATASASPDGKSRETSHWSYEGATGPEHWASLSEDFKTCEKGREQSPVDLTEDVAVETDTPITVHYKPVTAELVNNGHTVQANVSAGSSIVVDGTTYQLRQFHFHLPSDGPYKGRHFPRDRDHDLVDVLAPGHQAAVALTEAHLRLPTDVPGSPWAPSPSAAAGGD